MNHRYAQPTHEAVVKFSEVRTIPEFRDFHEKLRRQAGYFAKTRAVELAVYFVREIERKNLIHLHLLIRTNMDDPAGVLGKIVQKASGTTAELAHCENIRSVATITRYTVKDMADVQDGEREVLLFKKGLGLNLSEQFGGYFVKTKGELRKEWFGDSYIEEWRPPEPQQRRKWQPSEEQLAADAEGRQDEDQSTHEPQTDEQREATPSWPLARHHRQSVMASALPVISRVREPVFPPKLFPHKRHHQQPFRGRCRRGVGMFRGGWPCTFLWLTGINTGMKIMTFPEWLAIREGLWLNVSFRQACTFLERCGPTGRRCCQVAGERLASMAR